MRQNWKEKATQTYDHFDMVKLFMKAVYEGDTKLADNMLMVI